ncbi:MAG: AbrB/MazE/SpoVT family DNA-binding domain-containing protein [Candidatus Hadarchaeales archaeon]
MNEKIEGVVKVSPKGQIVIPKELREKLGISAGEKLLVISKDRDILLKKLEVSAEEIGERMEKTIREKGIDVDKLISEALEWARKSERS